jgi:GT2 family glycosyltransferase/glycosyltransferase involved in cell wall biosynthesis
MALILARLRFVDMERAATDLQEMLSRIAVPHSEFDISLVTKVSSLVDAAGWCGLGNAGRLTVSTGEAPPRDLTILLDGHEIPSVEPRQSKTRCHLLLPRTWRNAARIDVLLHGRPLIGSPLDITRIARVEGFVESDDSLPGIRGWCRYPADRERVPAITITALANTRQRLSIYPRSTESRCTGGDEFALRHSFAAGADSIDRLGEAIRIAGPNGHVLYGSPIRTQARRESARAVMVSVAQRFPLYGESHRSDTLSLPHETSAPVAWIVPGRKGSGTTKSKLARPVDIVIPVYRGRDATLTCIASVRAHSPVDARIIVIADGSPDRDLIAALSELADRADIMLHVCAANQGYPGAANIGIRMAAGHDVLLLNADTVVTDGWLVGLRDAVAAAEDIGTATPLSNDAAMFSYPRREGPNSCPDAEAAWSLATLAAKVNQGEVIDVPTGHAFCLYVRAECLEETGLLRDDIFAQGYGEASDFCMRARHLGWRHVAVPAVFVAHRGAVSFDGAREDLAQRNLRIVNRLHPGYDQLVGRWLLQDPLAESRRRIDLARLQACLSESGDTVLLVTHSRGGGIRRHVTDRIASLGRMGRRVLLLEPGLTVAGQPATGVVRLDIGFADEFPNLRFSLPNEQHLLLSCLRACGVQVTEVHSLVGHSECVLDIVRDLQAPLDLVIHDYSWFCPRITLTTGDHRYCGEPPITTCYECLADSGADSDTPLSLDKLIDRTSQLMNGARSIVAASSDSARRMTNRFGRDVSVKAWEKPRRFKALVAHNLAEPEGPVRVCVVGAIGYEKGYNSLLRCARMAAAADMLLEFVVVGYTCDDKRLLDTGAVRITGAYTESEAVALIKAQRADLAWLPSVWPETWSYVLTQIWEAGLHAVVHDIGAPAERVRASGHGTVVPLALPPGRLLGLFLEHARPSQAVATNQRRSGELPNACV